MYYVDFSGWTKEEVCEWLKKNSNPFIENYEGWTPEVITKAMFDRYPNEPAITFKDETLKVFTGYCYTNWYKMHNYTKVNVAKKISIQDFYSGKPLTLKNGESLTLTQILNKDNDWWDGCHDFIQWLFPTVTVSKHCENAPILTKEDAIWINENHKHLFDAVCDRFFDFLDSQDMTKFNHNHLRITRFLECTSLLNSVLEKEVVFNVIDIMKMFSEWLPVKLVKLYNGQLSVACNKETFKFWVDAMYTEFE